MACSNLALFGGAFFTPILVGKITHTIGWPWSFYLIAIFCGALLPLVFLFVPEHAFRRDDSLNTDIRGEDTLQQSSSSHTSPLYNTRPSGAGKSPDLSIPTSLDEKDHSSAPEHRSASQSPPKVSFARSLLPFNGRKTDESFLKLVMRPLPLFLHPAIFWACLVQGTLIGWTVMIGVVLAVSAPIYQVRTTPIFTSSLVMGDSL